MTLLFTDPLFLQHETGRHVEVPARLRAITARLERVGLMDRCQRGVYEPLTPEKISTVHDPRVVERVREAAAVGGMLDADTVVCPESYHVALAAGGACTSAVEAVLQGEDVNALCL